MSPDLTGTNPALTLAEVMGLFTLNLILFKKETFNDNSNNQIITVGLNYKEYINDL